MYMSKRLSLTLAAAAVAGLAFATPADNVWAISVTNTGSSTTVDDGSTTATVPNWSLNGGNTAAVFFSAENNGDPQVDTLSVTYGGENMSIVQDTSGGRWSAAIAYLTNPAVSTGNLELSLADSSSGVEFLYTPISLSNVGSVAASKAVDDGGGMDFDYTTAFNNGYVLGAATNNDFQGNNPPNVSGNPDIFEYNSNVSANFSTIHVHGDVPTAGSYTDTYNTSSQAAASVAFNPVPAPGSFVGGLALLALAGGSSVMRRRRA
jgi:hypothetical protein